MPFNQISWNHEEHLCQIGKCIKNTCARKKMPKNKDWKYRKPINYILNCHNSKNFVTADRRNNDGNMTAIIVSTLVKKCYTGNAGRNNPMTRQHTTRNYYCWSRRFFVKFIMWTIYNVSGVPTLDKAVCISCCIITLEKGMNPTLLLPAMGK